MCWKYKCEWLTPSIFFLKLYKFHGRRIWASSGILSYLVVTQCVMDIGIGNHFVVRWGKTLRLRWSISCTVGKNLTARSFRRGLIFREKEKIYVVPFWSENKVYLFFFLKCQSFSRTTCIYFLVISFALTRLIDYLKEDSSAPPLYHGICRCQ